MGVGKICVKTKPFYLVLLDLNAQTRISTHLLITRSWCSWKAASIFLLKWTGFAKALKNTSASCVFKLIISYLSMVFLAHSSISPRYAYLAASSTWVAYRPIADRNPLVAQTLSYLSQAASAITGTWESVDGEVWFTHIDNCIFLTVMKKNITM